MAQPYTQKLATPESVLDEFYLETTPGDEHVVDRMTAEYQS